PSIPLATVGGLARLHHSAPTARRPGEGAAPGAFPTMVGATHGRSARAGCSVATSTVATASTLLVPTTPAVGIYPRPRRRGHATTRSPLARARGLDGRVHGSTRRLDEPAGRSNGRPGAHRRAVRPGRHPAQHPARAVARH